MDINWDEAPKDCIGYSVSTCLDSYWVGENDVMIRANDFGIKTVGFTAKPFNFDADIPAEFDNPKLSNPILIEPALMDKNSRQSKISNIGNILHNMSCSMDDEDEQNQFGGYASFCWDLAGYFHKSDAGVSAEPIKPIYTNEMADKGELPSVGMECIVRESEFSDFYKCKIEFINDDIILIKYKETSVEVYKHFGLEMDIAFKPLTPPKTDEEKAIDDLTKVFIELLGEPETDMKALAKALFYDKICCDKIHGVKWVGES